MDKRLLFWSPAASCRLVQVLAVTHSSRVDLDHCNIVEAERALSWFRPLALVASQMPARAQCSTGLAAGRTCDGPRSGPHAGTLEEGWASSTGKFVPVGMWLKTCDC
jgi:hypothetical protein